MELARPRQSVLVQCFMEGETHRKQRIAVSYDVSLAPFQQDASFHYHAHMAQPHHSLQPQMPTCLCVLMSNPSNVAMTFEIGSNPVDRILQNVNLSRKECFGGFESRHGW